MRGGERWIGRVMKKRREKKKAWRRKNVILKKAPDAHTSGGNNV